MLGKSNSTYYFEQKMLSTHLITNLSALSERIAFALEEKFGTFWVRENHTTRISKTKYSLSDNSKTKT